MNQVLDYSKDCAYCSTPMLAPPRDGPESICAYLHTDLGIAEFKESLRRNSVSTQRINTIADTPGTDVDTESSADTPDADTNEPVDTDSGDADTPELTRAQQWRLDNPALYQAQKDRARDRRNGLST